MTKSKRRKALILGLAPIVAGGWLRLTARDLAWPREWSFSGPREDTIWAIQERAYEDLGIAALAFGLAIMFSVIVNWLWDPNEPV